MIKNLTPQKSAELSPSGLKQYKPVRSKKSSNSYKTSANQNLGVEQFGLFLDENKLPRCWEQLNNATLSSDNKNPHVELIIRQTRNKVKHSSVNNMLKTIRERFWILRGRQAVKCVLRLALLVEDSKVCRIQATLFPIYQAFASPNIHHLLIPE